LLSFTAIPAAPVSIEPRTTNNGRIPPRFATGSICSLVFFFIIFKPIPIFVIAAQTIAAVALSPRIKSFAVRRFRAFALIYCRARSVPRDYCFMNKLCRVRDMLRPMDPSIAFILLYILLYILLPYILFYKLLNIVFYVHYNLQFLL